MSVELGPIKIIVMGQSLGSGLSRSYDGATTDGVDQLTQHFQDRTEVPVEVLQASVPSTSLLRRYRSRRSWWDETTHKPGRLLLQTTFMYPEADIVLWSQGERDAEDAALDIETYDNLLANPIAGSVTCPPSLLVSLSGPHLAGRCPARRGVARESSRPVLRRCPRP